MKYPQAQCIIVHDIQDIFYKFVTSNLRWDDKIVHVVENTVTGCKHNSLLYSSVLRYMLYNTVWLLYGILLDMLQLLKSGCISLGLGSFSIGYYNLIQLPSLPHPQSQPPPPPPPLTALPR